MKWVNRAVIGTVLGVRLLQVSAIRLQHLSLRVLDLDTYAFR
jgi:hypothetical protein